jgi:phage shock protein E
LKKDRLMRITLITGLALLAVLAAPPLASREVEERELAGSPLIDFDGFARLTQEVRPYRAKRLLPLGQFKNRARDPRVLLLDARSAQAFAEGHIDGAVNLPFPDFNAESLAATIGPDRDRPILIYCNNNFRDNLRPVVTKALPLALNIQTFVNLYGYGYRNIWELGEAVTMNDPRVGWATSGGPALK